jgi:hypothetical protein
MFELLIAVGLFAAVVWMIAHAIFLLMRGDGDADVQCEPRDALVRYVEQNYGAYLVPENPLGEEQIRRL